MSVTPAARVPFIGTFLVLAPWPLVAARRTRGSGASRSSRWSSTRSISSAPRTGFPAELARAQPDLAVAGSTKRARLREVLEWLARDFRLVPLREAARSLDTDASGVPAGAARS